VDQQEGEVEEGEDSAVTEEVAVELEEEVEVRKSLLPQYMRRKVSKRKVS